MQRMRHPSGENRHPPEKTRTLGLQRMRHPSGKSSQNLRSKPEVKTSHPYNAKDAAPLRRKPAPSGENPHPPEKTSHPWTTKDAAPLRRKPAPSGKNRRPSGENPHPPEKTRTPRVRGWDRSEPNQLRHLRKRTSCSMPNPLDGSRVRASLDSSACTRVSDSADLQTTH